MQALNRMTLRFDSKSINESFARMTVAAFVAQLDPTLEELNDIKTVVSEAVTNAIVHGYRDRVGEIIVAVRLLEDQIVEIKVKDHGCGILISPRHVNHSSPREITSGLGWDLPSWKAFRINSKFALWSAGERP